MKKTHSVMLIVFLILASCQFDAYHAPSNDPDNPDDLRLVATWERLNVAFDFTAAGSFRYYRTDTGETLNSGWYSADPDEGELYIEDPAAGMSQLYVYWILYDEPIMGDVTLRLAPASAPGSTADWEKVD